MNDNHFQIFFLVIVTVGFLIILARFQEFYVFFSKIAYSMPMNAYFWIYFRISVIQNIIPMIIPKKIAIGTKDILIYFSYIANFVRIT